MSHEFKLPPPLDTLQYIDFIRWDIKPTLSLNNWDEWSRILRLYCRVNCVEAFLHLQDAPDGYSNPLWQSISESIYHTMMNNMDSSLSYCWNKVEKNSAILFNAIGKEMRQSGHPYRMRLAREFFTMPAESALVWSRKRKELKVKMEQEKVTVDELDLAYLLLQFEQKYPAFCNMLETQPDMTAERALDELVLHEQDQMMLSEMKRSLEVTADEFPSTEDSIYSPRVSGKQSFLETSSPVKRLSFAEESRSFKSPSNSYTQRRRSSTLEIGSPRSYSSELVKSPKSFIEQSPLKIERPLLTKSFLAAAKLDDDSDYEYSRKLNPSPVIQGKKHSILKEADETDSDISDAFSSIASDVPNYHSTPCANRHCLADPEEKEHHSISTCVWPGGGRFHQRPRQVSLIISKMFK